MRVNTDYETWNAVAEEADTNSVLNFWRAALKFRSAHDVLVRPLACFLHTGLWSSRQIYGDFTLLAPEHEQIFAFTRTIGEDAVALVVLNFSTEDVSFSMGEVEHLHGKVKLAFSNYSGAGTELGKTVELKGYEGRVYLALWPVTN
jgi:oligo-1,6-glucosidase